MNLKQISLYLLLFCLISPPLLHADVVTDGSVGTAKSLTGPDYTIPETLGTIRGNNLFHSFEKFSINTQESATFTGSDSIKNVISRVTGGEKSEIDGTLRSNVGKADFYFINPGGVVFGPNTKVDVPAAFHVGTTDELKFADGASFKASKSEQSTLTQAAPESFGFLGKQSASIEVNGTNIEINGSTLSFAPESKVSLTSSKDIVIKGTETKEENGQTGLVRQASLVSEGGEIALKATGDLLMENAAVATSGNGGGKINVKAGNAKLSKSTIASDNTGSKNVADGGGVEIKVDKDLEITHGSRIQSNVSGSGDSGTIKVEAENMLIKQEDGDGLTGIFIEVEPEATGNGKTVGVDVKESLKIEGVAGISSSTSGFGDAASVNVAAGSLKMDGEGRKIKYRNTDYIAGIASNALKGSSGNTNGVSVYVDNLLEMARGCIISGYSNGTGDGSNVNIKAGQMRVDATGANEYLTIIATSSASDGKSVRTDIEVDDSFELLNGAQIFSETSLEGNAGDVSITAGTLRIDNPELYNKYTGIWSDTYTGSGNAGNIDIKVNGMVEVLNGGKISSSTWSDGDAGEISITAGELRINDYGNNQYVTGDVSTATGIWSDAYAGSQGNAGKIELSVSGLFELLNGSQIASGTWSEGNAGKISITAGEMKLVNQYTGISSNANYSSQGDAGEIELRISGFLELLNGAQIASGTWSKGNAGKVSITAGEMKLVNQYTGISSNANLDSQGDAGEIELNVSGSLELLNGGRISSATYSQGNAGTVKIKVSGLLDISNGAFISSDTWSTGDGNKVSVNACTLKIQGEPNCFTGIWSDAEPYSQGNAGTVEIIVSDLLEILNGGQVSSDTYALGQAGTVAITTSGLLNISNGGQISSSTYSKGDAGEILIAAGNCKIDNNRIDGQSTGIWSAANLYSQGNAGNVDITVLDLLEILNGGQISSATYSIGDAGSVFINAGNIKINHNGIEDSWTGIWSDTMGSGNAGTVDMVVSGLIELLNGGWISSDTYGEGNAGNLIVNADELVMTNAGYIGSAAFLHSTGYVGDIRINANSIKLMDESLISIKAKQTLSEEQLESISKESTSEINLKAKQLHLDSGSMITSESRGNVSASQINIQADTIFLHDGQITTSAKGENGDGGNITITGISSDHTQTVPADFLIMQDGSIQADTVAKNASGGEIDIDNVKSVITDKTQELLIGGKYTEDLQPGQNVIRAAAPEGNPGNIKINEVQLDMSSSIINVPARFSSEIALATDPCLSIGTKNSSSLVQKSRGGFSEMPSEPSSISFGGRRLDELLLYMDTSK